MYSNSDKAILNKAVKALRTLEDRQDDRFAVLQEKVAAARRIAAMILSCFIA